MFGLQDCLTTTVGAPFRDLAGSVVGHAMGGWIALPAVLLLGAWVLTVGWFGFNVMSAQTIENISGLVAVCASGVAFMPQLLMALLAIAVALTGGFAVYSLLKKVFGLRLD